MVLQTKVQRQYSIKGQSLGIRIRYKVKVKVKGGRKKCYWLYVTSEMGSSTWLNKVNLKYEQPTKEMIDYKGKDQ